MLYKEAGIPDHKYKSNRSEKCFGRRYDQEYTKEGLRGSLNNRSTAVKKCHKYEKKWRRYMKDIKKQNKMLFRMAKHSGSHCELKNIKKIYAKALEKNDSSCSSSSRSDYDSSFSSDIEREEIIQSSEYK